MNTAWKHPRLAGQSAVHALWRWWKRWRPDVSRDTARVLLLQALPEARFEREETGNAQPQAFWSIIATDGERALLVVAPNGEIKTVLPRGVVLAP